MERKIGEIFNYHGEWYQCVEQPKKKYDKTVCALCAFQGNGNCELDRCSGTYRSDNCSVIFKKLEKVGGPCKSLGLAIQNGVIVELYKTYTKPILPPNIGCILNDYLIAIKVKDMKTVRISKDDLNFLVYKIRYGILPNHTDCDAIIAEITDLFSVEDVILSNSENIGKNLKEFNLEAAKSGKPVCTRDGRNARIICFDVKGDICPIIALVEENGMEVTKSYDVNGRANYKNADNYDLMMLSEKKEGWVNVYNTNRAYYYGGKIFKTKDEAMQEVKYEEEEYISTVKISWEE